MNVSLWINLAVAWHLPPVGTPQADSAADAAVIDVECVNGTDATGAMR